MKKNAISAYLMRTKWFVFLLVAIILVVFGRTIETPSLTKSAIVLGIGIDYNQNTQDFEVSTQSVLVGSSNGENSTSSFVTSTANGKTIAGAMDAISRQMGLIVSLAHCNVVFFSPTALTLDHLQLIYPLTSMYALPEQTIIVTGDCSPKEMLSLRIGTTISSAFFLQQALVNEEGSDGMIRTTAKDFLARSLSFSKANAIPYIVAKKMQSPPLSEQGDGSDNFELDISRALVFNHKDCHVIEGEYAEILALYHSHNVVGTLNYTSKEGVSIEFKILKKQVSVKANGRKISAQLELTADMSDVQHAPTNNTLSSADNLVKDLANQLAKECEARLEELFELSKSINIDFLSLQEKAYQVVGRHLENDCLDTLSFEPSVKITVRETG